LRCGFITMKHCCGLGLGCYLLFIVLLVEGLLCESGGTVVLQLLFYLIFNDDFV
jgi:hypothetical protein